MKKILTTLPIALLGTTLLGQGYNPYYMSCVAKIEPKRIDDAKWQWGASVSCDGRETKRRFESEETTTSSLITPQIVSKTVTEMGSLGYRTSKCQFSDTNAWCVFTK